MTSLSIGKLATAANVSVHTIQYYERAGLLPFSARSGYREYAERDYINGDSCAWRAHWTLRLEEIAEVLALESGTRSSEGERAILDCELADVDCVEIDSIAGLRGAVMQRASFEPHTATEQSSESCGRSVATGAITKVSNRRSTGCDGGEPCAVSKDSALERSATLEAANRELQAFVHSVSHELRAPLRAIEGFSKLLLEHCSDRLEAQAQHYLCCILSAEQRMKCLIDALLRLSRLEQMYAERDEVDLRHMVLEIVEDLRSADPHRQVDVVIADLPRIQGDPVLIRQAFENLLSNAFKFTRSRPVARIQVGYFTDNEEVIYFVRDNGAGFDMQYAARLFGVFQRLHHADEFEGTGIGLALVKRIVDRHGGRVWAEGVCNVGATLYIAIPQDRSLWEH